jgi:ERCC4-type nuclease
MSIIDSRERDMLTLLPNFRIQTLDAGDYIVNSTVIERKTWADYYASILDGRIFNVYKMLNKYPTYTCILLLEGDKKYEKIVVDHMERFITPLDISVVETSSKEETVKYLLKLDSFSISRYIRSWWPASPRAVTTVNLPLMKTKSLLNISKSTTIAAHIASNSNLEYKDSMKILKFVNGISIYTSNQLLTKFSIYQINDPKYKEAILATKFVRINDITKQYTLGEHYEKLITFLNQTE